MITIYTDGACKGNGQNKANVGGYGAIIYYPDGSYRKIWGGEQDTTNNKMELTAAIEAIKRCPQDTPITLFTDSNYVKNGISRWINTWRTKNWCKADGKAVLNRTLWQALDTLNTSHQINWQWVKGHQGNAGNEIADRLANDGINSFGDVLFDKHDQIISQDQTNPDHTSPNQLTSDQTTNTHTATNTKHTPHRDMTDTATDDNTSNNTYPSDQLANSPSDATQNITTQNTTKKNKQTTQKLIFSLKDQNAAYDGDTSRLNPDFLPILPEPIHKHAKERQLIMDTETTGLDYKNGDKIVEIGIIELVGRKFTGEKLHVYLNPQKTMNDEVIKVHGISNDFVSDKPLFADVAERVFAFMAGAEIIAHNATFDMCFLDSEFVNAGYDKLSDHVRVTDSLALAKQRYPGQGNSLNALVKRLNVGKKDRTFHGALLDSEILAEVYLAMTAGQVALDMHVAEELVDSQAANHQDLSALAHLLVQSASDYSADNAWRQSQLG